MEIKSAQPREEQIVGSWLKSNGYFRVYSCNSMDLEADSSMRRIFVHIKKVNPNESVSEREISKIKSMAIERNREPWVALLEPASIDDPSNIIWINLTNR